MGGTQLVLDIMTGDGSELRTQSTPVAAVDGEIRQLVSDLFDTLHACHMASLSAPQCGQPVRIFVTEVSGQRQVYINPEQLETKGTQASVESCASFPDLTLELERPETIVLRAIDIEGASSIHTVRGLEARLVAHELDHLEGVLYHDHLDAEALFEQMLGNSHEGESEDEDEQDIANSLLTMRFGDHEDSLRMSEETAFDSIEGVDTAEFLALDGELQEILDLLSDGVWKITLAAQLLKDFELEDEDIKQLQALETLEASLAASLEYWERQLLGDLLESVGTGGSVDPLESVESGQAEHSESDAESSEEFNAE